jgi:hypothetical protein
MNVLDMLYKCQPVPDRDPLLHGVLTNRASRRAGGEQVNFATQETSSDQADFLGCTPADTDWMFCAAPAYGAACSQGNGSAACESRFKNRRGRTGV